MRFLSRLRSLRVAMMLALLLSLSAVAAPSAFADSSTYINGYPGVSYTLVIFQLPGQYADVNVLTETCTDYCYYGLIELQTTRCGIDACYKYTNAYVGPSTRVVQVSVYSTGGYLSNYY